MSSNQVVKVRRDSIAACMTCPICNKLFREATTISECLHTFCRKCIHKKLSDEELEYCPVCNIDLGCVPLEKLRPDHNLQDVRSKIFPSKRRRVKAPEVAPSVTLPLRRKERSLSSLVVSTPRVSTQTTMTGKRSKVTARKKSRGSSFSIEKSAKKEEDSMEDRQESSSSRDTLNKFTQNLRQNSSTAEPSTHPSPDKETENGEPWEGKVDLWKPLNCLVEVANRSKSSKFTSQGSTAKLELPHTSKSEGHVRKPKGKDQLQRFRVQDDKESPDADATESEKPKKLRRTRKKKTGGIGESSVNTLQAVVDADTNNAARDKRITPIWFRLVPFEERNGELMRKKDDKESSYVKLNDGNIPVSMVHKLVMRKLNVGSEHEIELRCMGRPIVPTLTLSRLLDLWLQTQPASQTISAKIGSSAKDYMLEISYGKKTPGP